ncbi:hypothetical protein ACFV0H_38955 [Streptomyces erythrochromogenes]|uniref:hypothetical protein n=1 Tax=Streptomyces erythrochromogenes TaxID=285574 RepID=UPI0022558E76|nr:hypothetical protein [Streptomyces erythrochromogenes]
MTRAAGRPAALPKPGYQAPQRLFLDDEKCLVRFFPERGGPAVDYDFAAFPVARELVVWMATAFAGSTAPAGRRRTTSSATSAFGLLRRFAQHLASLNRPPVSPAQLRAAHLESFMLARLGTPNLNRELPTLRSVLRFAPDGAGQDFLARLARKGLERNSTPAASYTTAEFDRITTAARTQLRRAADRILAGRELLARWRAGRIDREAEPRAWKHGELLDHVDRQGDVPRKDTRWGRQPDHRISPETVARRHSLDPATLKKLLAGELDTVLGGCTDHLASPHSPAGEPCRASFLLCLSCPCARATPAHLPVLVAVHEGLEARKQEMTPLRWAERFAGPVAQLADLLAAFPTAMIATTRAELTAEQRALAERCLTRGLDLT